MTEEEFYKEAFDRNRGLILAETQKKFRKTRIAIPGTGGAGGVYTTTLARLGIGAFHIADFDTFSLANFNRQAGAMMSTIDKQKQDVMEGMIRDINPYAHIATFGEIQKENIDDFLDGVDIVVDGMDFFQIDVRRMIFKSAYKKGIPVITAAPLGFGSAVHIFDKHSMTFDDYFNINDGMSYREKIIPFGIGTTPALLKSVYMPLATLALKEKCSSSSIMGRLTCANFVATEVYKIIDGLPYEVSSISFPYYPYVKKIKRTNLWFWNRQPFQPFKKWYFSKKVQ